METQTIYNWASLINLVIILIGVVAGLIVLRKSVVKETNKIHQDTAEMQKNAMEAMREEITSLKNKVDDQRLEIKRLNNILKTIAAITKNRGFIVEFDDEIVHVKDATGTTSMMHIQEDK